MDKDIMYILGNITRAIWPEGSVPTSVMDTVLVRPATGLAMLVKQAGARGKMDNISTMMSNLPADLKDPQGGISIEDQGPFWLGYYQYFAALTRAKEYGAAELEKAGKTLYGERWQTDLSRDLGLSDARRVRQWIAGERPIPAGVWGDICALLRMRKGNIDMILNALDGQ